MSMTNKPENSKVVSKDIKEVLTAILLTMFVAMTSVTIVGNALPTIMAQLHGTETTYTWIVTASLLASTVATPIFGRLGDLFNKKFMMQLGIFIFALGSLASGFAPTAWALIGTRILQGVGMGAQTAMAMTIMATILPPRERGRYNGYFGAVTAGATVSGPLIGGAIVATPWLGWRWCFWALIPFGIVAMYILQKKLHLEHRPGEKRKVDYWGSALITCSVSLLLVWMTALTHGVKFLSWPTFLMLGGTIITGIAFFIVESRHPAPVVPLWLLRTPSTLLAISASVVVGTVMTGPPVFLGQYFQVARGLDPMTAGLAMIPLMVGSFVFSTVSGQMVTRRGRWKRYVVAGTSTMFIGALILSFTTATSHFWVLWIGMFLVGAGQGATLQNLVLAVQNVVPLKDIGAAGATVAFFRSLGGAVGVQLVGAIFAWRIASEIKERIIAQHIPLESAKGALQGGSMSFHEMPKAVETVVRASYGDALGWNFMFLAGMCFVAVVMTACMKSTQLRSTVDLEGDQVRRALAKDELADELEAGLKAGKLRLAGEEAELPEASTPTDSKGSESKASGSEASKPADSKPREDDENSGE